MTRDLTYIIDEPWGFALLVVVILSPRIVLRSRTPSGLAAFGSTRLMSGYLGAVVASIAAVFASDPLSVRPWVEALPVRAAVELMAVSVTAKLLLATTVAWLAAAYVVAPLTALLGTFSLANGLLVIGVCVPVALAIGWGTWLAWPDPSRSLSFTIASSLVLLACTAVGFSVGARVPWTVRFSQRSAAQ